MEAIVKPHKDVKVQDQEPELANSSVGVALGQHFADTAVSLGS